MKGNSSSEGLRATLASAWCDSAGQRLPGQKQAADIPAGKHQPPCSATPGHTKHITVQNASPSSVAQAAGGDASLHGDVMSPKPECFLLPCGPAELRKLHPHSLSAFLTLQAKLSNWLVLFYSRQWNVSLGTSVLDRDPGCCSNGTAFSMACHSLGHSSSPCLDKSKHIQQSKDKHRGYSSICGNYSGVITTTLH